MASPEIEALTQALARLPGFGSRSARRAVLHLVKRREAALVPLGFAVDDADIHPWLKPHCSAIVRWALAGGRLTELKVDGGMVANDTLMQFQADMLGVDVVRPQIAETTALGAAYAAGLAVGYWESTDEIVDNWSEGKRWSPSMDEDEVKRLHRNWTKAISKTLDWVDEDVD